MFEEFQNKVILVTGGTGSIGAQIVEELLKYNPKQIRVFSRDETKQFELAHRLGNPANISWLIGDIRDKERLNLAMENVNIVFHAAALKHVLSCEVNPFEAVKTNVYGTQNIIDCAFQNQVEKVVAISTDKATDPVSVMGCTKLLSEKMMLATYHYKGHKTTKFSIVRFGNVLSTRGSVIPLFHHQISKGGPITVTDDRMLRFFMSINQAVSLIFKAVSLMQDREIFILKMPVIRISDLARALVDIYAPKFNHNPENIKIEIVGRKKGERYHEKLLSKDESSDAMETDEMFIITPVIRRYDNITEPITFPNARQCTLDDYSTSTQAVLSIEEIKQLILDDEKTILAPFSGFRG